MLSSLILKFAVFTLVFAHVSAHSLMGPPPMTASECDEGAPLPFQSYHLHVLFWGSSESSTSAALALRSQFISDFSNSTSPLPSCDILPSDPAPSQLTLCSFGVSYVPSGPFLTAQWSFFIPTDMYFGAMTWAMQRRGELDVFIHGNSGCSTLDHVRWPLVGGVTWPIDSSVLSS